MVIMATLGGCQEAVVKRGQRDERALGPSWLGVGSAGLGCRRGALRARRRRRALHVVAVEVFERPDLGAVDDAKQPSEVLPQGVVVREAILDQQRRGLEQLVQVVGDATAADRKSTRLNSSHVRISYAVF